MIWALAPEFKARREAASGLNELLGRIPCDLYIRVGFVVTSETESDQVVGVVGAEL